MPNVKVYNMKGQEVGTKELSNLFEAEYNESLIHQAVVTRLANMRQGTKGTLTRTEVRGGGRKPWRQKGTGNAGSSVDKGRSRIRSEVERFQQEDEQICSSRGSFVGYLEKTCG